MLDSPDPVTVGSPLTYTIGVTNLGPDAGSNVTVTNTLPATVTLVSANASIGSCSGTTTVTCVLGSVDSGTNISIGIVVTPTAPGEITNTATVTAAGTDPDGANNTASATTTVNAAGPTTFVVTNINNTGAGSLRQAILDANARPGPDTITFAIAAGSGVRTIVSGPQPVITDPVTIDGTTQSGFAGTPIIELSGIEAGAGANGLVVNAGDSVIRGLIINRWPGSGIVLQAGTGNAVVGKLDRYGRRGQRGDRTATGFWFGVGEPGRRLDGRRANVMSANTIGVHIGSQSGGSDSIVAQLYRDRPHRLARRGTPTQRRAGLGEAIAFVGPRSGNGNVISGNTIGGGRARRLRELERP